MNDIFVSQSELDKNNISGKITYTNIMEFIPPKHRNDRISDWDEAYKTEWRWRFLMFPNNKLKIEISYITRNNPNRYYFNKYGKWVIKKIDPLYEQLVLKDYYYYSKK